MKYGFCPSNYFTIHYLNVQSDLINLELKLKDLFQFYLMSLVRIHSNLVNSNFYNLNEL